MANRRAQSRSLVAASGPHLSRATANDPSSSDYVTLSQAAHLAPGRPSACAPWRWARHGLKARDGTVVRLRHVRAGRQVLTTADWLREFFEAVAAADQKHFEARESLAARAATDAAAGPPARPAAHADATGASTPDRKDELDAALREEGL